MDALEKKPDRTHAVRPWELAIYAAAMAAGLAGVDQTSWRPLAAYIAGFLIGGAGLRWVMRRRVS